MPCVHHQRRIQFKELNAGSAGVPPAIQHVYHPSPGPLGWLIDQACLHGILHDVFNGGAVVLFIADVAVEVVRHPEGAFAVQVFVGLLGGEGFPCLDHFRQGVSGFGFDQHMDMIGHDAPCNEGVALLVKVLECVPHQRADGIVAEVAGAFAAVLVLFDLLAQGDGFLGAGGGVFVPVEFFFPLGNGGGRDGVMKAE